jgi:hypothetical protein
MASVEYCVRGPFEDGSWSVFSTTTKTVVLYGVETTKGFTNWVSDHESFEDAYAHCCYMKENYS